MAKFFEYLKTASFRKNLLIAITSVAAIVLIVFFSLGSYTRHGTGIPVPMLKGLSFERAVQLLDQQGFEYKIDSVYVLDQKPGTVVEQDPDPSTNVKKNRTIYLTIVTQQAPDVTLPELENSTFREVISTISNFGLKLGDTTYISDIARDRVLEIRFAGQRLHAGSKLPKGSRLDLVLGDGRGASEVEIPDLINQELDAAKFVISQSGLTLGTITYEGMIADSTTAIVVAQSPMRSDSLSKTSIGTRINLTVSEGN